MILDRLEPTYFGEGIVQWGSRLEILRQRKKIELRKISILIKEVQEAGFSNG